MKTVSLAHAVFLSALCIAATGCNHAPGKPPAVAEASRPDQVVDFPTLYKENCAACHGSEGKAGMVFSLSNPVYLAMSGEANIQYIATWGRPGTLMPGFSHQAGGMLTDQQIQIIAHGIVSNWGRPNILAGITVPDYSSTTAGDVTRGKQAFATFCGRCHGGEGDGKDATGKTLLGSIVDPAYLALASDQNLRTTILAGLPERKMPDWRSDLTGAGARPMTDQEITDVVAWLAAHRVANPGQPYQNHQ